MSSSSSDSDDYEPMRKIQINIRPKEDVSQRAVADVNLIKASVEAWRPLGPPTHPSLARRQSSLSSVSSMSFGTGSIYGGSGNNNIMGPSGNFATPIGSHPIHSSPSCSSLVNEFNTRSTFSNLMSTTSRTSSPLMNQGDTVPVAIAIQESIELIVKGHYDPNATEPKYQTRSLGNIKVAFSNAFARSNYGETGVPLKLRMHSTDNIIQYYASALINDLDPGASDESPSNYSSTKDQTPISSNGSDTAEHFSFRDAFDADTSGSSSKGSSSKSILFNMDSLSAQLRSMYDKCPNSRYYNVDILRYQICPISSISEAPLQVCAYWNIQAQLVKLRIDFKHSMESGFNLDRMREVTFAVKLADFIPDGVIVSTLQNGSVFNSNLSSNGNNNNNGATNFNRLNQYANSNTHTKASVMTSTESKFERTTEANTLVRIPPPPLPHKSTIAPSQRGSHRNSNTQKRSSQMDAFQTPLESSRYTNDLLLGFSDGPVMNPSASKLYEINSITQQKRPHISYKPQAHWDSKVKELTWRFDTLLSYHKNDGMGSLLAKLDFRDCNGIPHDFLNQCKPVAVDVKFLVTDSTLSKVSLSVESPGYKMSLLKREIRSGRYKSEPYFL